MAKTMSNLECAFQVLENHRLAGNWTPRTVAMDLLEQLGLKPHDDAANAKQVMAPDEVTEDDVTAAETAAKAATDKAEKTRAKLEDQRAKEAESREGESASNKPWWEGPSDERKRLDAEAEAERKRADDEKKRDTMPPESGAMPNAQPADHQAADYEPKPMIPGESVPVHP